MEGVVAFAQFLATQVSVHLRLNIASSVISKFFEALNNKKVVEHLIRDNLSSNKTDYDLPTSMLILSLLRVREALDNRHIMEMIVHISKAFYKV